LLDLIDTRDEEIESKYQHVTRMGGILRAEIYAPCVYGGQGTYVFCTGAPLSDAHGNPVGAIGSIRDITQQTQVLDIIDFLPDATFVTDKEGKVIAWNRAIGEMAGIRAADMVGKGYNIIVNKMSNNYITTMIDKNMRGKREDADG
jgi:PAS domain-containing protein